MKAITIGATGTFATITLSHANEILAFISGFLTIAYMGVKLFVKVKKEFGPKPIQNPQPQPEEVETDI